jgi:SPP1 family predicted phage head-tail adaptor
MPAAGLLDRMVQFRRRTLSDGPLGQVETWANHGQPIPAEKHDLSDGERWRAGEVQAHVTTRFKLRWSAFTAGLTPRDRLTFEGREFDISGIKEPPGTRRQWLEITAAARIDQ